MAAKNPKYKSLDDILEALKDDEDDKVESSNLDDDAPKSFPEDEPEVTVTKSVEIAEVDDEDPLDRDDEEEKPEKTSVKRKASSKKTKEDEEDEDEDEDEEPEEELGAEVDDESASSEKDEKVESSWRTAPANLSEDEVAEFRKRNSTVSKPASDDLDEPPTRPSTPPGEAKDRWASYPEYPLDKQSSTDKMESSAEAEPPTPIKSEATMNPEPKHSYESNLDDLASESYEPAANHQMSSEPEIRHINHHSSNNQYSNSYQSSQDHYGPENDFGRKSYDYRLDDRQGGGKKWHFLILIVLGVITIAAAVFLLKNEYIPFIGSPSSVVISSPSPSPEASQEPTPTPLPEIDRTQVKLRILNGTTTTGLAGSLSTTMKEKGYQIERTGNNSSQNVAQTEVRAKASPEGLAQQLVKDLAGTYEASIGAVLAESEPYDALIVIGEK